jgi:hypothetical protein
VIEAFAISRRRRQLHKLNIWRRCTQSIVLDEQQSPRMSPLGLPVAEAKKEENTSHRLSGLLCYAALADLPQGGDADWFADNLLTPESDDAGLYSPR